MFNCLGKCINTSSPTANTDPDNIPLQNLLAMSRMELDDKEPEFQWGKKRGVGGAKKDIKFYDSFTFDGINYLLYDCVYLFKKDESEPYIGKIVKIWEQPDGKKKVKILWFFLAKEIMNYLGDTETMENEIFLASGEGVGATNINPLEAIAGKCYVICTSKDVRNPLPSKEALEKADYIFYRTFDVGNYTISEKLTDKIAGIEVKYLLNQDSDQKSDTGTRLKTIVTEGTLKTDETVVLVHQSKPEPLRLVENIVEDGKSEQITSPISKTDVIERKHLNEDKHLSNEKSASKFKHNSVNDGEKESNGKSIRSEEDTKSSKKNALPSIPAEKRSLKKRPQDDSVSPSDDLQNKGSTGTKKRKISSLDGDYGNELFHSKKVPSEKVNIGEKKTLPDVSAKMNKDANTYNETVEVTRRPVTDRSKWFKPAPWETRIRTAEAQGTLVFLDNLDPTYTSGEIEDIIYHSLKQNCSAKVIQQGTFQSPHSGQAFIIFGTADAAEQAVHKIDTGCLMLPGGRPVLATRGMLQMPPKSSTLVGHLSVDKLKLKQHEEWKKAVATSHCSQPNTIEYEMSMDWILLQEKSANWFNQLNKKQGLLRDHGKKTLKAN